MATEIERKFLVDPDWNPATSKPFAITHIRQGYLSVEPSRVVRIRTLDIMHEAYREASRRIAAITIKGLKVGASAKEWEYEIPFVDAATMLDSIVIPGSVIDKTRYLIPEVGVGDDESAWEVDVFHGRQEGIVVAEIELQSEGQQFVIPKWLRREVTENKMFANSFLCNAEDAVLAELARTCKSAAN